MLTEGFGVHPQQLLPSVRHGLLQVSEAVQRQDVELLKFLLGPGGGGVACAPEAEQHFLGITDPAVLAVRLEFAEGLEILLDHGANAGVSNRVSQETLLHEAARLGGSEASLDVVRLLCDRDPELVHQRNMLGETPLLIAVQQRGSAATDMVRLLLIKGAEVNVATRHGITPLMRASSPRMIVAMTREEMGCTTLNAVDLAGRTALYWAASRGNFYVLLVLLFKGADLNMAAGDCNQGLVVQSVMKDTPLLAAALKQSFRCFGLLLAFGAKLERAVGVDVMSEAESEAVAQRVDEIWGNYARGVSRFGHMVRVTPTARLLRAVLRSGAVDPESVVEEKAGGIAKVLTLARARDGGEGPLVKAVKLAYGLRQGPVGVLTGWTPKAHALYPRAFRDVVATVLTLVPRLRSRRCDLPLLPTELWHVIISTMARRDFLVRSTVLQN